MLDLESLKNGQPVKLLVQFDDWLIAKDGQQYRQAWGNCTIHADKSLLGFSNKHGANWLMQIGSGKDAVFVMGCRIHYAQVCDQRPSNPNVLCIS